MAVSPRQPGSSIKPLTYVAAFEKGWTPGYSNLGCAHGFPTLRRPERSAAVLRTDELRRPFSRSGYGTDGSGQFL